MVHIYSVYRSVADPDPNPMFLGFLNPDPLVRGTDTAPDPDPSIISKIVVRKTLILTVCDYFMTLYR
jgi:hypothetical protein